MSKRFTLLMLMLLFSLHSYADSLTINVVDSNKKSLGYITFEDSPFGLLIKPSLINLPKGKHGFHIHEFPNCDQAGMSAGGHLDPKHTGTHQGPYGNGHLGDLPVLIVDESGSFNVPLLAPRLTTQSIIGHAVMIHGGGDNYSDTPALGGGGARIGCGRIY